MNPNNTHKKYLVEIITDKFAELSDYYKTHKLLVSNPELIKTLCTLSDNYSKLIIENIQTQHIEYNERAVVRKGGNSTGEPRKKTYYNGLYAKIRKIVVEDIKLRAEDLKYCTSRDISTPKLLNSYIISISHKVAGKFKEMPEYSENAKNWDALPEALKTPDIIVLDTEQIIEMANEVIDTIG